MPLPFFFNCFILWITKKGFIMQYNHKQWLDKIFSKTLVERSQTRTWVSRFVKVYSKQSTYKNNYLLA